MTECVQDMYSRIKINFFVIITSFDCDVEKVMQFKNVHIFNKKHDMYLWYIYVLHMCCTCGK